MVTAVIANKTRRMVDFLPMVVVLGGKSISYLDLIQIKFNLVGGVGGVEMVGRVGMVRKVGRVGMVIKVIRA